MLTPRLGPRLPARKDCQSYSSPIVTQGDNLPKTEKSTRNTQNWTHMPSRKDRPSPLSTFFPPLTILDTGESYSRMYTLCIALAASVKPLPTVCFQMFPQVACRNGCIVKLVASLHCVFQTHVDQSMHDHTGYIYVTFNLQMCPQTVYMSRCKFTLVFSPVSVFR